MCSRPRTFRRTRPALSSTRMCFDVELSEIGKALATSVTRASESARRARMARRVGSETAEKTRSSTPPRYSPIRMNIAEVARERNPAVCVDQERPPGPSDLGQGAERQVRTDPDDPHRGSHRQEPAGHADEAGEAKPDQAQRGRRERAGRAVLPPSASRPSPRRRRPRGPLRTTPARGRWRRAKRPPRRGWEGTRRRSPSPAGCPTSPACPFRAARAGAGARRGCAGSWGVGGGGGARGYASQPPGGAA
jgi:hypothetical protein